MKNKSPHRVFEVNLFISVLLTLIINFSYLVSLNLNVFPSGEPQFRDRRPHEMERINERRNDSLRRAHTQTDISEPSSQTSSENDTIRQELISKNGGKQATDSSVKTVDNNNERQSPENTDSELTEGAPAVPDSLEGDVYVREQNIKSHYNKFDPMRYYQKQYKLLMFYEVSYFLILSFILLTIATARMGKSKRKNRFLIRIMICMGVIVLCYYLAPQMTWRGRIIITLQAHNPYNPMMMLKIIIVFIVAAMYGKIYELVFQRQTMVIENEQLKNENLISQYTVLVNQINPHFFFNSLNSLSMLIRERQNDAAQTYIDELSNTFRYIIQESKNNVTTLENELNFVESYKYLFEIRYEGKFFVKIDVDKEKLHRILPSLSMQPLIENAVKHNTITKIKPLSVTITTEDEHVVISNPIMPKIDDSEIGTGIGLKNLSSRYMLIMNKPIIIENDGVTFTVKLPLSKEEKI